MKHLIAVVLMCLAAGAQGYSRENVQTSGMRTGSALVVQGIGTLGVRVDGQIISLGGAVVKTANGQRSSAPLAVGMPITFLLAPEGTSPRIKEVWTIK